MTVTLRRIRLGVTCAPWNVLQGVTLPKLAIFAVMDLLSARACIGASQQVRITENKSRFTWRSWQRLHLTRLRMTNIRALQMCLSLLRYCLGQDFSFWVTLCACAGRRPACRICAAELVLHHLVEDTLRVVGIDHSNSSLAGSNKRALLVQIPASACPANHAAATAPNNICVAAGGTCRWGPKGSARVQRRPLMTFWAGISTRPFEAPSRVLGSHQKQAVG